MSAERAELADMIGGPSRENGLEVADAILAAGYRKPRTITTVEELDAMGFNAIVLHDEGFRVSPAQKHAEDMRWYVPGCLEYIRTEALLPATVLHEGDSNV